MEANNNQALIDGLRRAADFLESKPDMPPMDKQRIALWVWDDKELLRSAARQLGSFTKAFDDNYFVLTRPVNEAVDIQVLTRRELLCKKIVTWDCPDDESLLRMVEPPVSPSPESDCERIGSEQ